MPGLSPPEPAKARANVPPAETVPSARGGDTRQRLIGEAERLFGEHGLHGVTLRQINKAAGQRNESALHYHFGSRHALIMAIMQHRSSGIDARRAVLIDHLIATDRTRDLHAIIKATLMPMVEILDRPEGISFVRFMAQVINDPDYDLSEIARSSELSGLTKAMSLIEQNLAHLPQEISAFRCRSLIEQTVMSLAIWSRREGKPAKPATCELLGANLIDALYGFLSAPVSPEAAALAGPSPL
ncbi:MAG: TetR family transcriptional regulator [Parvibaculum sp.]